VNDSIPGTESVGIKTEDIEPGRVVMSVPSGGSGQVSFGPVVNTMDTNARVSNDGTVTLQGEPRGLVLEAKNFLSQNANDQQRKVGLYLLSLIEMAARNRAGDDLPPVHASLLDDQTIGLTWRVGNTLVGFNLDETKNESVWFILSGDKDEVVRANGEVTQLDNGIFLGMLRGVLDRYAEST
jgi:hypothetical protein